MSTCLEVEVLELRLPALSDFSKVKCILTVNSYTQCLQYPFKSMTIPKVDNYSVLEISVTHLNQVIASIEVPLTLFKSCSPQTFKLVDHLSTPEKRKLFSNKQNRSESNEITLAIKHLISDPTIEEYKKQIKELEEKLKKSGLVIDEGYRSRNEMQSHFEDITKQLTKMIKAQEDTIGNLASEKEKMREYLENVESSLRAENLKNHVKPNPTEGQEKRKFIYKTTESNVEKGKIRRTYHRSIDISNDRSPFNQRIANEKLEAKCEFEELKRSLQKLEHEKAQTSAENLRLNKKLEEYKGIIEELEFKVSEMSISTSLDRGSSEKAQSNEGIVLSLRGEISRMAVKYKNRISKLVESRNCLLDQNKSLLLKLKEYEALLLLPESQCFTLTPPDFTTDRQNTGATRSDFITDRPIDQPRSYKLLGKYASNIQKVEQSLSKSPRLNKENEDLMKYIHLNQITSNKPKPDSIIQSSKDPRPYKSPSPLRPNRSDPIDSALFDFLSLQKSALPVNFIKEKEGIYTFGSKRVFLKLENGRIYIRVGGGFMVIDEFIKVYTPFELDKATRDKPTSPLLKASASSVYHKRSASAARLPSKSSIDYS